MERRALLRTLAVALTFGRTVRARADCAMPETYCLLLTDASRPLPRDGALLAYMVEGYGERAAPRLKRREPGLPPAIDADVSFESGGRPIACTITYVAGDLFRLQPSALLAEGVLSMAGFHSREILLPPREYTVRGMMPAQLAPIDGVSGTYAERRLRSTRWGTPTLREATITLSAPIPDGVQRAFLEISPNTFVRFEHRVGERRLTHSESAGGSHCGDHGPLGATPPANGYTGTVVLVDSFGRVSRSSRRVRLG